MTIELIIFSVVLILSVVAHFFFWRDSKKRFSECLKKAEALTEKLRELEANDEAIDGLLDDAEVGLQKMGDEIEALRSALFVNRKHSTLNN